MKRRLLIGIFISAVGLGVGSAMTNFSNQSETDRAWVKLEQIRDYLSSQSAPKSYVWNLQLKLNVTRGSESHTSRSAIKVTWTEKELQFSEGRWNYSLEGQVPYVVFQDGTLVSILFRNEIDNVVLRAMLDSSIGTAPAEDIQKIGSSRDRKARLCTDDTYMPYVVSFSDPIDSNSISVLEDGNACLELSTLGATPISENNLSEFLPWLDELKLGRKIPTPIPTGTLNSNGEPTFYRVGKSDFVKD